MTFPPQVNIYAYHHRVMGEKKSSNKGISRARVKGTGTTGIVRVRTFTYHEAPYHLAPVDLDSLAIRLWIPPLHNAETAHRAPRLPSLQLPPSQIHRKLDHHFYLHHSKLSCLHPIHLPSSSAPFFLSLNPTPEQPPTALPHSHTRRILHHPTSL